MIQNIVIREGLKAKVALELVLEGQYFSKWREGKFKAKEMAGWIGGRLGKVISREQKTNVNKHAGAKI